LPIDAPGYRVARRLGTQARCSLCSRPRVGCCIHRQRIWPLTAQRKKRWRCSRR
jgi:hypothetical protein